MSASSSSIAEVEPTVFQWRVHDLMSQLQAVLNGYRYCLTSDTFQWNGYQMCLCVYPISHASVMFLGVSIHMVKGGLDDRLSWPMMASVSIDLMDQYRHTVYATKVLQYTSCTNNRERAAFNKPRDNRNRGCGTSEFIQLDVLSNNRQLLVNKSILIRCEVAA